MSFFAETLWDLIELKPAPPPRPAQPAAIVRKPMQERYDEVVREMKAAFGIRVRKWRSSTSGCAWQLLAHDGRIARLIESPYPRGPMSCAVFLHEVGHHAIGFDVYRTRCLEEYHAWRWSIKAMREHDLNVTPPVLRRVDESLRWAVRRGVRRGLRTVPAELVELDVSAW